MKDSKMGERAKRKRNMVQEDNLIKKIKRNSMLRSTCGEQWRDQTRHTPPWRSTFVGRWRERPR